MRRIAGICLGLTMLAAGIVGCGGSNANSPAAAPNATRSSATSTPMSDQATAMSQLVKLALTSAEASSAGSLPVVQTLQTNGDLVGSGSESTLDLCNKTFPSDSLRLARHQVVYIDKQQHRRVDESNELVRYQPGGAAQAYREIQSAARNCPAMTQNKVSTSKVVVQPRDPRLAAEQLTVTYSMTTNGRTVYSAAVYQYVGDLFSGVYVFRGAPREALNSARALAAVAATKLQHATT